METKGHWCDNHYCPDCGKIGADNIKMHRYAERRFHCTTCQRTFSRVPPSQELFCCPALTLAPLG